MKPLIFTLTLFFSGVVFAQTDLKIQTLNFNSEATNAKLAAARYPLIRDAIRSKDLDVVLLQEDWQYGKYPTVASLIAQDLNYDITYHFEDGVTGIYDTATVILSKKSLHFRNAVSLKLPHSALSIGDGTSVWVGLGEINMLVGGTIDLPNGEAATIWTTHLSSSSQSYRLDQIRYLLNSINSYLIENKMDVAGTPTFIGGDMNSGASSAEAALFRQAGGFTDSWLVSHPTSFGWTLVNDPLNPEYNPMVHSAGQIPAQYVDQGTERLDYIYFRNLPGTAVGTERIFTAPLGRIWMSDHYSVLSIFNFAGISPQLPDADSDMTKLGSPTYFQIDLAAMYSPKLEQDFDVYSLRGFAIQNTLDGSLNFTFLSHADQVYNSASALLNLNEIASFTFFSTGDYPYQITVTDVFRQVTKIRGTVHVH